MYSFEKNIRCVCSVGSEARDCGVQNTPKSKAAWRSKVAEWNIYTNAHRHKCNECVCKDATELLEYVFYIRVCILYKMYYLYYTHSYLSVSLSFSRSL